MITSLTKRLRRTQKTKQSFTPPSVEWLLAHRGQHTCQTRSVSPLASLYRMYEYIVVANNNGLRTEIEHFFKHSDWAVSAIPDPQDKDPVRYAILSVLPTFMVAAYNRLIERGLLRGSPAMLTDDELEALQSKPVVLEKTPPWAAKVPKLKERFVIPEPDGREPDQEDLSSEFLRMNIMVAKPHVMFV